MTSNLITRSLTTGYTAEFDSLDEQTWYQLLDSFEDANIYQTWAYADVISGKGRMSHFVLRKDAEPLAIAQVRIVQLPILKLGVAYVFWGPLWKRAGAEHNEDILRQAIRALRAEYVCKRKLTLRLFPLLFDTDSPSLQSLLREEGFLPAGQESRGRTILMDLNSSLEDLRAGMKPHWKRELKVAERYGLEVTEASADTQFETFITIYREMVSRKRFVEPNDINQFRQIQKRLPERFKMKIMLCQAGGDVCAGLICSAIGNTAVYLFGATSNAGMKSRGSYFMQWKLLEQLKQEGIVVYNLNGINPAKNPGTYKFKNDLAGANGKDAYFLGRFDSHSGPVGHFCVLAGDRLRSKYRSFWQALRTSQSAKTQPKATD